MQVVAEAAASINCRFRVMASETEIIFVAPSDGADDWAEARLRQLEARWSRFVPTSDISAINAAPGRWVQVNSDTIELIRVMQVANTLTGGGYDPTFLHQLIVAGYSASIDDPDRITVAVDSPCTAHTVHDVEIDARTSSVFSPYGLSLDPGGIGKGFAADLVVTELLAAGTAGVLVSIGGDIAAAGVAPTSQGWHVHVEDPFSPPAVITTLGVSAGGIATSSTQSRRWMHQDIEEHHVIDPVTGERSATDLATVTVVAKSGWLAEAHATAALLLGSHGATAYLEARELTGVVVDLHGGVSTTADLLGDRSRTTSDTAIGAA